MVRGGNEGVLGWCSVVCGPPQAQRERCCASAPALLTHPPSSPCALNAWSHDVPQCQYYVPFQTRQLVRGWNLVLMISSDLDHPGSLRAAVRAAGSLEFKCLTRQLKAPLQIQRKFKLCDNVDQFR